MLFKLLGRGVIAVRLERVKIVVTAIGVSGVKPDLDGALFKGSTRYARPPMHHSIFTVHVIGAFVVQLPRVKELLGTTLPSQSTSSSSSSASSSSTVPPSVTARGREYTCIWSDARLSNHIPLSASV